MIEDLNANEIEALLKSELVARIGCHADGQTCVVPITHAYDGDAIIGHSLVGLTVKLMRKNPNARRP